MSLDVPNKKPGKRQYLNDQSKALYAVYENLETRRC